MNLLAREVTRAGRTVVLQSREFALLELLMRQGLDPRGMLPDSVVQCAKSVVAFSGKVHGLGLQAVTRIRCRPKPCIVQTLLSGAR